MESNLLSTIDRALQQRARSNAAAAVRDGMVHAAERREAAAAIAEVLPVQEHAAR